MNTIEVKYKIGDVVVLQNGEQAPKVLLVDKIITEKKTIQYHLADLDESGREWWPMGNLMSPSEWLNWKLEQLKQETASAFSTYQTLVCNVEALDRRVKEKGQ